MTGPAEISRQAAEWFAVMVGGQPAAEERARFRQWLERDPAHRRAYAEYERLWAGAEALPDLSGRLPRRGVSRRAVMQGGVAAGLAVLALGGGAWAVRDGAFADHRTGTGERRLVRLPDGSTAELSAATALSVHFGADARRIDLLRGEAFFTVAPDAARPFRVAASGGTVTALGTAFSVALGHDGVRVVVAEHAVSVTSGGGEARLQAGETLHYGPGGLSPAAPADLAVALSWRQGRLAFMSAPLSEVLEIGRAHV